MNRQDCADVVLGMTSTRKLVMGVLNVTPDSFSDGGLYLNVPEAVRQAQKMADSGANIIDVGGESTRPGSLPVPAEEQIRRIAPVVHQLSVSLGIDRIISIDTTRSAVAEAAFRAGARIVNDVSAGTADSGMFEVVSKHHAWIVLMHMQGTPLTMQDNPAYNDVVEDVATFLDTRATKAIEAGIPKDRIIIDPGIGFGKTKNDNLQLLASLDRFVKMGYPVLLGTSRKRFMGAICNEPHPVDLLGATIATTVLGVMKGVRIFRVHDARANRQAIDVITAILSFSGEGSALNT